MRSVKPALIALVASIVFAVACFAGCVYPADFCEPFVEAGGKTIQNPHCSWLNHTFLQGEQNGSSTDGYQYDPAGSPCGAVVETGIPCGVLTTTNTCSESAPTQCYPSLDPSCECAPGDYECALPTDPTPGGGDGDGGGDGGGGASGCGGQPCKDGVGIVLQQEAAQAPIPSAVNALLQKLATANGIHIQATMRLFNPETGATQATSTYEYWERGGHYRIQLGPGGNYPWMDMAFDGTFTQGKPSSDTVEVKRGDDRVIPLPDGPLALAMVPFRLNNPTECPLCQLRLADLKRAMAWRRAAAPRLAKAERAIRQGVVFDAGFGRQGEADAQGRLVRMVWPADAQQHRLDVRLGNYRPIPGSTAMFPMLMVADLQSGVSVEYAIQRVELSPSFNEAQTFNLGGTASKFIFVTIGKDGTVHTRVRGLPALPTTTQVSNAPAN